MRSDQRQPGWKVQRPISPPASLTSSTVVLSGVRVSSVNQSRVLRHQAFPASSLEDH